MNELYHHGIKGMHWGVRRYQNPDGSLTNAGKRRARKEAKQERISNAKNAALLSDKELTDQIIRLQREKQLKDLTSQTVAPGRKKVLDFLDRYGNQAFATVVGAGASAAATVYISNKINPRKSTYETMREQSEAQQRLATEGFYQKNYDKEGKPRKGPGK